MRIPIFILLLSLLSAFVTRFYLLGAAPAGMYLDETAQGYNAYSILKTGRDEFGMPFPVIFRSFTDFKTPVYIYLIVPLIRIFGLNAFTVRLPSFLASLLTLPVLFFLVIKLTGNKAQGMFLASLTTLLLSVSPWHILFGRTDFECNLALFLFLVATLFFYSGLKKPLFLLLSACLFSLSLTAYHSERILVPLILLYLFLRHNGTIFDRVHRHATFFAILIGFLILLPTLFVVATPGFLARAATLTFDTQVSGNLAAAGPFDWLVNNHLFLRVNEFLSLYLAYFSPRNLFFLGDSDQRVAFPELATFFFWQLPFFVYGLYFLLKDKKLGHVRDFTLLLLAISPLPAALTHDPFTSIRSLPLVIPICIVISLGFFSLWSRLRSKKGRLLAVLVFTFLIFYSLLKLYSSGIILNEYFRAKSWNYGWQAVAKVLQTKTDPSLPVVVDDSRTGPYSELLFYLRFDPATYQKENFEVSLADYYNNMKRIPEKKIGRITVRNINWELDLAREQYLIGDALAISLEQMERHNLQLVSEIKYPDGSIAFRIVKTPRL